MWLKKLIAAFIKQNGRKPNAIETIQLKFRANDMANKGQVIKPNFGGSLREFTRREDLYEGLPKALRNVKNPEEVKKLLDSGAIKIGKAPKTKKTKDPVDPKFKRAVESQEEKRKLIKEFEARNKDSAFNFAFKKYKDIDKKPMEMDEVVSIYTNLNKYPKGRSIIFGDIAEIERGHMLPNIGNRSREMIVNKLNKLVVPKKQPNPFKKAPDEVTDQIEMDFTDWDPKGMKGGGIAHMLGQPRVPMMYGGDPGFAFEYGGSWADWRDNHQHMMPVTEYIGTKLPKDRLPFRQELSGGGLAGLPPVTNMIGPPLPAKPKRMNPNPTPPLTDLPKHDFSQPFYQFRKRFKDGGFDKGRRNFMKMAAGLASLPFVGKLFKAAKPAAKAVEAVKASDAVGMPAWFPKLVDKVIKDGTDVTKQYGTVEREVVHIGELPSGTKVMVTQDLTTGNTAVDVGMGKHGWESGRHGQPARLELNKGEWTTNKQGKGVKTKDEFFVEEAEFTGGHPENIKYEESSIEKYGDHASDFSEVEYYATGKNVDKFNVKGTRKGKADEFAQGRAEIEAEQIDEFASGGIAHMLGR